MLEKLACSSMFYSEHTATFFQANDAKNQAVDHANQIQLDTGLLCPSFAKNSHSNPAIQSATCHPSKPWVAATLMGQLPPIAEIPHWYIYTHGKSLLERLSCLSSGVLRAYLLECIWDEVFNYFLLLLPRQLDGAAVSNNCSGRCTAYCLHVMFFHVRMQTSIQILACM